METVEVARSFLGKGVCALDLAGAEALYPTSQYGELFSLAKGWGVPFTLHAGEAAGPESIWQALKLGASRIGHGVRAREDRQLLQELFRRRIPLELCPTSNLQTKAVLSLADFPLREYLEQGLLATLNTDNMTVSRTTLAGEYALLEITPQERRQLLLNSVEAAFLPNEGKTALRRQIEASLAKKML